MEEIKGIITDCITGESKEAEFEYEIVKDENNRKIFKLIGGPTGYESFFVDDEKIFRMRENGWSACIGTKNVYDTLFISAIEMRKVLDDD